MPMYRKATFNAFQPLNSGIVNLFSYQQLTHQKVLFVRCTI